jgi:hypothetical protein
VEIIGEELMDISEEASWAFSMQNDYNIVERRTTRPAGAICPGKIKCC